MLKRNKNRIQIALFLLITAAFSILQIQDAALLRSQYKATSVRLTKEGITQQEIENALADEESRGSSSIPEVSAWSWCDKAEIKNNELKRSVRITPVTVYGDMGLALPMTLICGNLVYKEDRMGCVLDAETAYELFGVEKADGNIVTYQNSSYYVRGVVKTKYPMFLIQGADSTKYSNLELLYQDKERGEEFAQDFMYQNGLGTDFVIIDGYFYSRMISKLLGMPLWFFFLAGTILIMREYLHNAAKLKPLTFAFYGLIGALIILGYGILLHQATGNPFYFPEKLIPSKWSDFDYWVRQYNLIKEQILQMKYLPPNPRDIYLVEELTKVPYNFSIMAILYLLAYKGLRFLK